MTISLDREAVFSRRGQIAGLTPPPGQISVSPGTNEFSIVATDLTNNLSSNRYQLVLTEGDVSKTLSYDLNGNLTNLATASYTNKFEWDAADRLVRITQSRATTPHELTSEFGYDGLGHRTSIIEKEDGTAISTNLLVWCGVELCEARNEDGSVVLKRFFGQGEQINGTNNFFTRDHLGSVREVTDGDGVLHTRYEYDPYGVRTRVSGVLEADFGFTGHFVHAPTTYCLTLFRTYSPDEGRWMSRDPLGEAGGINLYAYCLNNPVFWIDPYGLHWTEYIPDFLVDPHTVNFAAGMGDYLSFGLTDIAREGYGINDVVDKCSGAYKAGEYTGIGLDVAMTGGSLALKSAARNVSKATLSADRGALREALNLEAGAMKGGEELFAHHANPLKGHPGGAKTIFPTAGLPTWIKNSALNGRALTAEEHAAAHEALMSAEDVARGLGLANPVATAGRIGADAAMRAGRECN